MAIGQVLGRAYIEVHADTRPFAKELKTEVEAIAKTTTTTTRARRAGRTIGQSVANGIKEGVKKGVSNFGADVQKTIAKEVTGGSSSRSGNLFTRLGKNAGSAFLDGFAGAARGLGGIITSIGSSVGNVGGKGPFAAFIGVAVLAGIPALIGLVIGLVHQLGALVNIVAAIPGAMAVAAAAIIPVVVAFQGFGDALSAIISGDVDDIAAAIERLTPAARKVAREFQVLLPFFRELRTIAQEKFFAQFGGTLTAIFKNIGPSLTQGFGRVAQTMGRVFNSLLKVFADPRTKIFFDRVFIVADNLGRTIGPGLTKLFTGLIALADSSLPVLNRLGNRLGGALGALGDFLLGAVKDGSASQFFKDFETALDKAIEIGKSGWSLVQAVVGGGGEDQAAKSLIDTIILCLDAMTAFFESDDGKKSIAAMIELAQGLVFALTGVVVVLSYILAALREVKQAAEAALRALGLLNDDKGVISRIPPPTGSARGPGRRGPDLAEGGITTGPSFGWRGEDGPEAVIPLTKPGRARQIIAQAGLSDMVAPNVQVAVYVGNEQFSAYVDKRVGGGLAGFGRSMKYGPRPVGVG